MAPIAQKDNSPSAITSLTEYLAAVELIQSRQAHTDSQFLVERMQERQQRVTGHHANDALRDGEVPPASSKAIGDLPHLRLFPADKKAHASSTACCSICFDRLIDSVALVKLPCGHVFHVTCAVDWASRACTCAECRYELPTGDASYEPGRLQRMNQRTTVTCSCPPSRRHECFWTSLESNDNDGDHHADPQSSEEALETAFVCR